jgi:uncharacterized protein
MERPQTQIDSILKIVCDTNVLISGVLFGGHARQILLLSSRGNLTNITSAEILAEAEEVLLRPKFGLTAQQVKAIIALFRDTFEIVYPAGRLKVIKNDPSDDRILEAAFESEADCIVSGDRHLLSLQSWRGIRILSPADFMSEFETS